MNFRMIKFMSFAKNAIRLYKPLFTIIKTYASQRQFRRKCSKSYSEPLTVALASLDRARSAGPYLYRTKGIKVKKVATNANNNPAYWLPRLWKNWEANKGDTAPRVLRMKPWPAMAEEECSP